jgi:hypothetical protein
LCGNSFWQGEDINCYSTTATANLGTVLDGQKFFTLNKKINEYIKKEINA